MNLFRSLIIGRLAPWMVAILGFCYVALTGFRGFSSSTLDWLERSRSLADEIAQSPAIVLEWSAEEVSLLELIGAAVTLITPGHPEWVFFFLSALSAAIATAMIFVYSRRMAGPVGGWTAFFFIITCVPWFGLFTRMDLTFWVLPVLLGIIFTWHARALPWWKRTIVGAHLMAAGILMWPAMVLVIAILLAVDLIAPPTRKRSSQPGLMDGPSLPLDRVFAPLGALGLLLLYPLFWPNPGANLMNFFLVALETPAAEFVFRSQAYPPERPAFYTGAAWAFEQLPLAFVVTLILGLILSPKLARPGDRRLALTLVAVSISFLLLPVLFRQPRPFGMEFTVLFLATAIPIATLTACRFFSHALGQGAPSTKVRQVAIAAFLLVGISILIEAPAGMEAPERHRSPMTARLVGWSASGDQPAREDILPLRLIETSGADRQTPLYIGPWDRHLAAYRRMHLLADLSTTDDPTRARVAIRQIPPVSADRFSGYPATIAAPLPRSNTEIIAHIHRPFFLVDRVPDDS